MIVCGHVAMLINNEATCNVGKHRSDGLPLAAVADVAGDALPALLQRLLLLAAPHGDEERHEEAEHDAEQQEVDRLPRDPVRSLRQRRSLLSRLQLPMCT